jgi:hypothetical protein
MGLIDDLLQAADNTYRLLIAMEKRLGKLPTAMGNQEPISDMLDSMFSMANFLGSTASIESGVIHEAIPYTQSYKVVGEGGGAPFQCTRLCETPSSPIGVTDNTTLQPGTNVYYIRHPKTTYGLIIGVEPAYMASGESARSDYNVQGSRCGLHVDKFFKFIFSLGGNDENAGIIDWSARQGFDSMPLGEWCKTAETGLQFFLDPYMIQMRVDEMCGVFGFYWDQLLRVAGQNYQRWTGNSVLESYDDEGEHYFYEGMGIYPWEQLGMLRGPTSQVFAERAPEKTQGDEAEYAFLEPLFDDQMAFHRIQRFEGYIGQGGKRIILTRPADTSTLWYEHPTQPVLPGLLEETRALSGHLGVRGALGMTFQKRPAIPTPKRKKVHANPTGDSPDNYRPSSQYGSNIPHKVKADPDLPSGFPVAFVHTCGIQDMHANLFNWECAHPFDYHENDYDYPEESDQPIGTNQYIPPWTDLKRCGPLSDPPYEEIEIDHREGYTTIKVYKTNAYWTITDDGSIEWGDGGGASIRLAGGDAYIGAPGKIMIESGGTTAIWAGRDVALRAKQSVDVTATDNDIRLKAEHNLHMLAANDEGPWGMLLECRSKQAIYNGTKPGHNQKLSGIILHAPKSEILSLADNVYIRTGNVPWTKSASGVGGVTSAPQHGMIMLDAQTGGGDVVSYSHYVKHFVKCAVLHGFGHNGTIDGTSFFTADNTQLAGDCLVEGNLVAKSGVLAGGDFESANGHFYSQNPGAVGEGSGSAGSAVASGEAYITALEAWATARWNTDVKDMWYSDGRPGIECILRGMWFSLRVDSDYKAQQFVLYENRWQQMARASSTIPTTWEELAVVNGKSDQTFPFPGKKRMVDDTAFYVQDTLLYDTELGISKDRGGLFENAEYGTPQAVQLNCNYPILGR